MKTISIYNFTLSTVLCFGLFIFLCASCNKKVFNDDRITTNIVVPDSLHVAFAGGGWRAHTGHAAWVMSLLESNKTTGCALSDTSSNPNCLDAAFDNVRTVSGNSGGSWFSTMLMYDSTFVNQISGSNAVQNWGSTNQSNPNQGWLGKQDVAFSKFNATCGSDTSDAYFECILENFFNNPNTFIPTPNWSDLVKNLVYTGYDWQSYGNMSSSTRQPWAKDKSFLMAGTMLTNAAVLNDMNDEIFY